MKSAHVVLSLLFASLGTAATCNKSNAKPWNTSGGVAGCNGDAGCIAIVMGSQCNDQVLADSGGARCVPSKRAQTLTCSSSEVCFLYTDGDLMCLNQANGEYHDDAGGHGNYKSGIYTYADGRIVTNSGTATGTKTGTATAATKTGTTTTKTSGATSTKSTSASASASASASTSLLTSTTNVVGVVNAATTQSVAPTAAAAATSSRPSGAASIPAIANGSLFSSLGSLIIACVYWL